MNTLSRGKGVSAVGKVSAKHKPTITFVATSKGTFIKAQGAGCWTEQEVNGSPEIDYNFVDSAPFGFVPKESMSVGRKHGNRIELIGRMSAFGGFMETDTLNAETHQMIGESIFFGRKHKATEVHLSSSYHTTHTAPRCRAPSRSVSGRGSDPQVGRGPAGIPGRARWAWC